MQSQPVHSLVQLRSDIHKVLKLWHTSPPGCSVLPDLLIVAKMGQGDLRKAMKSLVLDGLAILQSENPRQHEVLRLRYLENIKAHRVSSTINLAESMVNKEAREGIDRLAEIVQEQEMQAHATHLNQLRQRLPAATQSSPIGSDDAVSRLLSEIISTKSPWIIGIEGTGGIGKTTLAREVTRLALEESRFAGFAWVTAKQDLLGLDGSLTAVDKPALTVEALVDSLVEQLTDKDPVSCSLAADEKRALLQPMLHESANLLVVDNLETLTDIKSLLPELQEWANPTKILFTSREFHGSHPDILHFEVPPLSDTDTLTLIRQEAALYSLQSVAHASDTELLPIYEAVGGNPLAIRLTVGQLHFHSLDTILSDLVEWRGAPVANLYTYLFHQAWENLDEEARLVWLRMPLLIGENATVEQLASIASMEQSQVRDALVQLVRRNLVNPHGQLNNRYYSIHNLTRTFLHRDVVAWQ